MTKFVKGIAVVSYLLEPILFLFIACLALNGLMVFLMRLEVGDGANLVFSLTDAAQVILTMYAVSVAVSIFTTKKIRAYAKEKKYNDVSYLVFVDVTINTLVSVWLLNSFFSEIFTSKGLDTWVIVLAALLFTVINLIFRTTDSKKKEIEETKQEV